MADSAVPSRRKPGWRWCRGLALAAAVLAVPALASPQKAPPPAGVPAPYLKTRDQAGHEVVKTEQFVVPVGTTIALPGLQFPSTACTLSSYQVRILQQVFNSLEEITENTVRDPDEARVAEFAAMTFDVRAYSAKAGSKPQDETAQACAGVVRGHLANLGTPAWRLTPVGLGAKAAGVPKQDRPARGFAVRVVFVRTK